MKKLLIMMALVSLAGVAPAVGQLDQDPDGIGLYADLEGMNNQLLTEPGVIDVHLLATNISGEMIKLWAASITIEGNAVITGITIPYEHSYLLQTPGEDIYEYGVVAFPDMAQTYTELTRAPIIHLASLQVWVSDTEPINLYLDMVSQDPEDGLPDYTWYEPIEPGSPNGGNRDLHPSSGSVDLPVMRINGDAPVPVEPKSWSDLKAVFR